MFFEHTGLEKNLHVEIISGEKESAAISRQKFRELL